MRRLVVLSVIVCLMLSAGALGCTKVSSPAKKPETQQQGNSTRPVLIQPDLAEKAKVAAATVKGVKEATTVVINKDISVAVKVTGFNRLRLETIRQEVNDQVEKTVPGYTVHVSTDKKIFSELQKIETEIRRGQVGSPSEIQRRFEKLNKDMHG